MREKLALRLLGLVETNQSDFSVPCQKPPPMRASDRWSMKVRENKEFFDHNFVCPYARASLGERQARVQEVPGPSTRPGGVGPRGQKPFSDKYFHEAFTWRPHASWPCTQSGKVRNYLLGFPEELERSSALVGHDESIQYEWPCHF
jgi:hypothetical protein